MLPGFSLILGIAGLFTAGLNSNVSRVTAPKYATGGIKGFVPALDELLMDVFVRDIYGLKYPREIAPPDVPQEWKNMWEEFYTIFREPHYIKMKRLRGEPLPNIERRPTRWDDYTLALKFFDEKWKGELNSVNDDWKVKMEYIRILAARQAIPFNKEQVSRFVRLGW